MVRTNQQGHDPIRLGGLYSLDDLAELGDGEWDEFLADDLTANERDKRLCPSGCQLPEVVVGRNCITPRSELFDHVLNGRDHLLLANRAGTEGIRISHTPFVLVRVKIEL